LGPILEQGFPVLRTSGHKRRNQSFPILDPQMQIPVLEAGGS
jgi:hypothetical protein